MKRLLYIILICIIGLVSCKDSNHFTIKANLSDCPYDHLFIVYDDPISKIDTIYPQKGTFTYEIAPDTITMFRLLTPNNEELPVIADKGDKMELSGTIAHPVIKTEGNNKLYSDFLQNTEGLTEKQKTNKAEELIKANPQSFVSAYLINQYFVQIPNPDLKKIESLIAPLNGNVKDSRILTMVLRNIPDKKNWNNKSDFISYISCKDRNQKYVSWNVQEGCYTLINLWASWDKESVAKHDSIYKIAENLPEGKFRVLNISLDYDKQAWLSACKADTKKWIEICDFKGWTTSLTKQEQINKIPANILIDHTRKKIAFNLFDNALYKKVEQLIENDNPNKKKTNNK